MPEKPLTALHHQVHHLNDIYSYLLVYFLIIIILSVRATSNKSAKKLNQIINITHNYKECII